MKRRLHGFRSRRAWLYRAIAIFALIPILIAYPVLALNEDEMDMYASINIMFYDPDAGNACGSTANCSIVGETRDEKFWSGLRRVGFSPEETAALMGNMLNEGGTPVTQEYSYSDARKAGCKTMEGDPYTIWTGPEHHHGSCISVYTAGAEVAGIGLGFIQWTTKDRREGYLAVMRDLGLLDKYFEGEAYRTYGYLSDDQLLEKIKADTGSEIEYWALWCAAIKYIYTELNENPSYTDVLDGSTDVGYLAGRVARKYEGCQHCGVGESSYVQRVADAERVWADYKAGKFDSVEGGVVTGSDPVVAYTSASEDGTNVTIIGDSITNRSRDKILAKMPNADIHAQDSKQFLGNNSGNPTGEQILKELQNSNNLRSIVVLALGTNGSVTESDLFPVLESIGNDHKIFLVTNYDDYTTNKYDNNNKVFQAAADVHDNVSVIDWAGAVKKAKQDNPGTTYIDNEQPQYSVHPSIPDGTELFADTLFKGITGGDEDISCNLDPGDPLSYLNQFIVDTNYLYNKNYPLPPTTAEHNTLLPTPLDDSVVTAVASRIPIVTAESQGVSTGSCWHATYCGQCTALSGWFTSMMTNYNYGGGHGGRVAGNLITANPGAGLTISHRPAPFSVFSEGSSSVHGHTGVVLKVENDYVLTIENNVGPVGPNKHSLSIKERHFAASAQFVDLSKEMNLGHLGKTWE